MILSEVKRLIVGAVILSAGGVFVYLWSLFPALFGCLLLSFLLLALAYLIGCVFYGE